MKKQIILTITAVIFVAGSILAFANNSLDELTQRNCTPGCCSQCPPDCCSDSGSSCCKK